MILKSLDQKKRKYFKENEERMAEKQSIFAEDTPEVGTTEIITECWKMDIFRDPPITQKS